MTVDGNMLLKMLEPVIRPGASTSSSPGASVGQGNLPLEQQSFEHMLAGKMQTQQPTSQVAAGDETAATTETNNRSQGHSPLGQLARIDQIENNSLRSLMSDQAQVQVKMQRQADVQSPTDQGTKAMAGNVPGGSLDEFLGAD